VPSDGVLIGVDDEADDGDELLETVTEADAGLAIFGASEDDAGTPRLGCRSRGVRTLTIWPGVRRGPDQGAGTASIM
jgi:hypothetical protein